MKITRKGYNTLLDPSGAEVSQHSDVMKAIERALGLEADGVRGSYRIRSADYELVLEGVAPTPVPTPPPAPAPEPPPAPAPPPPGDRITDLVLMSEAGGTRLPFTFGLSLRDGDVPAGKSIVVDNGQSSHAIIEQRYRSGCARFAVLSGFADLPAGQAVSLPVSLADPFDARTVDLPPAIPVVVRVLEPGIDGAIIAEYSPAGAPVRVGAVASDFVGRTPMTDAPTVTLEWDTTAWVGGRTRVLPTVDNTAMAIGGAPANYHRVFAVLVDGVEVFRREVDVKARTRVPLVIGSAAWEMGWWTGGPAPCIVRLGDMAYLRDTRQVKNYAHAVSETALAKLPADYEPNALAGISSSMGVAGSSACVLGHTSNHSGPAFIASGDARAYKAALVFALSGGSWSTHYTDDATGRPFRFSDFPKASLNVPDTPRIPGAVGGTNGTATISHQPSFGYLAYLLTGHLWLRREQQFWAGWNYLQQTVPVRDGARGLLRTDAGANQVRGGFWALLRLCETLAVTPTSDPMHADLRASVEANIDWYHGRYIAGTIDGGRWVSPMGLLGEYSAVGDSVYPVGGSNAWYGAGWMYGMGGAALAQAVHFDLPISADHANKLRALRDSILRFTIAMGSPDWYRRFISYGFPIGEDARGLPPERWYTAAEAKAKYVADQPHLALDMAPGQSLKQHTFNADFTGADSSVDYFGPAIDALAEAADAGLPGAAESWAAVSGASNFDLAISRMFPGAPSFAVMPRSAPAAPAPSPPPVPPPMGEIRGGGVLNLDAPR